MSKRKKIILSSLAACLLAVIVLTTLFVCGVFSVDMGEAVLTYKGERVTTVELSYWMATLKTQYLAGVTGSYDVPEFWSGMANETQTHAQCFDALLLTKLKQILISKYLFDAWKLSYPAGTDVDALIDEKKEYYKLYDEMDTWEEDLSRLGVKERQLRQIYLTEQKVQAVKAQMLHTLTAQSAEYAATLQNHFADHYLCVQYAVFYLNYDVEKQEFIESPTKQEQKRNLAKDVLAQGRSQTKTAVELIGEYSEYDTLTGYTNGWFLSADDNFDANLYREFAKTEIGDWGYYEFFEDDITYAYVWRRAPISNYDLMNNTEKDALATRAQDAYYTAQLVQLAQGASMYTELYSQYSVVTAQPSRNTNL